MIEIKFSITIDGNDNRNNIKEKVLDQYQQEIQNNFTFKEYFINHTNIFGEVNNKGNTSETFGVNVKDVILTEKEYNILKEKADILDKMRNLDN